MEASSKTDTLTNIQSVLKNAERDVCRALTEHYEKLAAETSKELEEVEKAIGQHLKEATPDILSTYKDFQAKLESTENTLRTSLEERRSHKFSHLSPRTRERTHTPRTHTQYSQGKRQEGRRFSPYVFESRKGKRPTSEGASGPTWKSSAPVRTPRCCLSPLRLGSWSMTLGPVTIRFVKP